MAVLSKLFTHILPGSCYHTALLKPVLTPPESTLEGGMGPLLAAPEGPGVTMWYGAGTRRQKPSQLQQRELS